MTTVNLEVESPRAEAFRDVSGPGPRGWEQMHELAETEAKAARAGPSVTPRSFCF